MMKNDPAIDAVRKARCDISREVGDDPEQLIAHYAERQAQFKGRVIHGPDGGSGLEETVQPCAPADAGLASRAPRALEAAPTPGPKLTIDELLASRIKLPPGHGPLSLEDMEQAIAEGALGRPPKGAPSRS